MDHIELLIIKKWNGTASKVELEKLNELTSALSTEERTAYQKLEAFWKSEGQETPEVSQTQLWNRLDQFIDSQEQRQVNASKGVLIPLLNWKIFSVAASIALIFTFGYFFWDNYPQVFQNGIAQTEKINILEKVNDIGQKSTLKLPDGSTVVLNSKSKITIPEKFVGSTREVTLEGEAYFDVTPNPTKPFIVKTRGAQVKVLGTSFNLKNVEGQDEVVLNVVEGKVKFSDEKNAENILVTANEAALLKKSTGQVASIDFNPDAAAWSKGELVFKSASFQEIISTLESWYGVNIMAQKKFSLENGFTGRYKNASLKEVLAGISFTVDFEYEIIGKEVIIK